MTILEVQEAERLAPIKRALETARASYGAMILSARHSPEFPALNALVDARVRAGKAPFSWDATDPSAKLDSIDWGA